MSYLLAITAAASAFAVLLAPAAAQIVAAAHVIGGLS